MRDIVGVDIETICRSRAVHVGSSLSSLRCDLTLHLCLGGAWYASGHRGVRREWDKEQHAWYALCCWDDLLRIRIYIQCFCFVLCEQNLGGSEWKQNAPVFQLVLLF